MKRINEASKIRNLIYALSLVLVIAGVMVVRADLFSFSLIYLSLLVWVVVVALLSNITGGLITSAIGIIAIIAVSQLLGIHPLKNRAVEASIELAVIPVVGLVAGLLSREINLLQRHATHSSRRVEEQAVYDEQYDSLKPDWAKLRLEEETLRAVRFQRPLSVILVEVTPLNPGGPGTIEQAEHINAMRALIRVARTIAQPPAVVARLEDDQVLLILPEETKEQSRQTVKELQKRMKMAVYFPNGNGNQSLADKSLGKPLGDWGSLNVGVAQLNGTVTGDELLDAARKHMGKEVRIV